MLFSEVSEKEPSSWILMVNIKLDDIEKYVKFFGMPIFGRSEAFSNGSFPVFP